MKIFLIAGFLSLIVFAGCGKTNKTELTFILSNGTKTETRTIKCPKDIGCDKVLAVPKNVWQPLPQGTICTKIWGGPERLTVSGTIRGQQVNSSFSLSGGCEIDRWDKISPLLKEVFGEGGSYAAL